MGDYLGQWEGSGLDVIAAFHNLEIGGDGSQILVRVLIGQVSKAKRLADLSGGEELLELQTKSRVSDARDVGSTARWMYLGGDVKRPIRDVEVPYNENEKCHIVSLVWERNEAADVFEIE